MAGGRGERAGEGEPFGKKGANDALAHVLTAFLGGPARCRARCTNRQHKGTLLPPATAKPMHLAQRLAIIRAAVERNSNFMPPLAIGGAIERQRFMKVGLSLACAADAPPAPCPDRLQPLPTARSSLAPRTCLAVKVSAFSSLGCSPPPKMADMHSKMSTVLSAWTCKMR